MTDEQRSVPIKVRVVDKRKNKPEPEVSAEPEEVESPDTSSTDAEQEPTATGTEEKNRDYLQDLLRERAEFDNFRKRTFRERQQLEARGRRQIVEHLLPVLDNFERAIAHGEGGGGVELVFKELKSSLEREGLAEIAAEGKPFDPTIHEAVESVEDPDVEHETVTQVYRRGYTFAGEVVRPAMVVVARPVDEPVSEPEVSEAEAAEGGT